MCAIFQLSFEDIKEIKSMADEITKKFGNEATEQCFNVDLYPKSTALVLGPQKKSTLMKWGFPMRDSNKVIFNARAESLNEKSMFRSSLANRCLIPATSFYEWSKEKKKYRIKTEPSRMIYMAALWKPYLYQGNKVYCFTIITTEPNSQIGQIHSRMPAIIPIDDTQSWLEGSTDILSLLKPLNQAMTIETV